MNPFDRDWSKPEVKVDVNVTVSPSKQEEKKPYADITILLDRSSSMIPMREAVVDGLNSYISRMRETPGDSKWSLVLFDDEDSARGAEELFPTTVFEAVGEREIKHLKYDDFRPRGATALVDAVCKTMRQTDARISGQSHVTPIMMIITDGLENSSKEFDTSKMREMVARREARGWNFSYLAANQDAWSVAQKYDIARNTSYVYTADAASGGVVAGSVNSFSFSATAEGMRMAITSGMIGTAHVVSGCVGSGVVKL